MVGAPSRGDKTIKRHGVDLSPLNETPATAALPDLGQAKRSDHEPRLYIPLSTIFGSSDKAISAPVPVSPQKWRHLPVSAD